MKGAQPPTLHGQQQRATRSRGSGQRTSHTRWRPGRGSRHRIDVSTFHNLDFAKIRFVKTCKDCQQTLPFDHFYVNKGMRDGRLSWCKKCTVRRYRSGVKDRAARMRDYVQAIKLERGCADCGYNAHPAALDFDHLPGTVKTMRLASAPGGSTMAKLIAEMEKCEVVCANCHRVRTAERRSAA